MKLRTLVVALLALSPIGVHAQVRAGSPELKLYEQITAEMNLDNKLELIRSFENQFPASRIMGRVYLSAVDVYRAKQDQGKVNEYAEKALQVDQENVTAMMLLARNYAREAKNLDRAMELAQKALGRTEQLAKEPMPTGYTALVDCDDGDPAHQNVLVSFGEGGGEARTPTLTGLAAGTVCTVVEQNVFRSRLDRRLVTNRPERTARASRSTAEPTTIGQETTTSTSAPHD